MVNTSDCGSDMRGFDSHESPHRGIAQLVERRSPKPQAEGSSPSAPATMKFRAVVNRRGFFHYSEVSSMKWMRWAIRAIRAIVAVAVVHVIFFLFMLINFLGAVDK